ncbi:oxidoreductase [Treponema sp.]|uniref:oxidoreductase n=1 Tax=Treponema sp. TaxID=166 RepID=UPI003F0FE111
MKVALITGASSGIGLECTMNLLKKGFTVYALARRTELLKEAESKGARVLYMDLTDSSSVKKCISTVLEEQGRIDVLVNNAGFGLGGSLEDIPIEEAKKQFEVNVFALMYITQLVLPAMRSQKSGRIINVASIGGHFSLPFGGWYHASKYSVEALSDALRMEVKDFGIKVVIIEPGMIQTDWGIIHGQNILKFSNNSCYAEKSAKAAAYYKKEYGDPTKLSPPKVISHAIVKSILTAHPKHRYRTGKYARLIIFLKKHLPECLFDFLTLKIMGIN